MSEIQSLFALPAKGETLPERAAEVAKMGKRFVELTEAQTPRQPTQFVCWMVVYKKGTFQPPMKHAHIPEITRYTARVVRREDGCAFADLDTLTVFTSKELSCE